SPRLTPWSPARPHVCGQRSARTKPSLPPDTVSHCLRGLLHGPAFRVSPISLLEDSPNETPGRTTKLREPSEHERQTPCSQLKTDLGILILFRTSRNRLTNQKNSSTDQQLVIAFVAVGQLWARRA